MIDQNKFQEFDRQGKPVFAWSSIYTPVEILYAAGVNYYRLTGGEITDYSDAIALVNSNYCSHILSTLSEGIGEDHQRFEGIVDVDECDQRKRMMDKFCRILNLRFSCFLELPRHNSQLSFDYFYLQMQKLRNRLEEVYGAISDDALSEAIHLHNDTRKLLQQIMMIYGKSKVPISYAHINNLIRSTMNSLRTDINSGLRRVITSLEMDQKEEKTSGNAPRIMIAGSYFGHNGMIQYIESLGASIVLANNSNGYQAYGGKIDEAEAPLPAIANHYYLLSMELGIYDITVRMQRLLHLIESQKIDYVIYFALKFCDINLMDYPYIKNALQKRNIPILLIEYEQNISNIESIKTRLETFLY